MKKVLIIGYLWPYCRYRGGSPRTLGLAKYLSAFNWEPVVLTTPLEKKLRFNFQLIEVDRKDIFYFWKKILKILGIDLNKSVSAQIKEKLNITSKKSFIDFLLNSYMAIFAYPDTEKYWRQSSLEVIKKILQKRNFNAIISVWPITAHLIAHDLKKKYGIPWIADFSHLWSQGYYYQYGPIRRIFDKKLEIKTLSNADCLTTISEYFVEILKKMHHGKPIYFIPHGFDPSWLQETSLNLSDKFTITYTGNIYPDKQDISKFFSAIKELIEEKKIDPSCVEIRFYGEKYKWLEKEANKFSLSGIVYQYGPISHSDSLKKQRESQILLHLGWNDEKIKGFYSSKIFEYLAAKRPILAVGGASDEVVKDLLLETNTGVYSREISEIKKFVEKFYLEYKLQGKVVYRGDINRIKKYSHYEMAKKFAEILNKISE